MADPQWAVKRACQILNDGAKGCDIAGGWDLDDADDPSTGLPQFARYIASKEEPPVDPLLFEAREIAAAAHENGGLGHGHAEAIRAGERDEKAANGVPLALAALRRGMELAKEQSDAR